MHGELLAKAWHLALSVFFALLFALQNKERAECIERAKITKNENMRNISQKKPKIWMKYICAKCAMHYRMKISIESL